MCELAKKTLAEHSPDIVALESSVN